MAEFKENIDWNKCILCQTKTKEDLTCPMKSKRHDSGTGYSCILNSLREFAKIDSLPFTVPVGLYMNDNVGILKQNDAVYHKSCKNKINSTELNRALKRCSQGKCDASENAKKSKRGDTKMDAGCCFFCGEIGSAPLHEFTTMEADQRVREAALATNDGKLMAKLSVGDLVAQEAKYHNACKTSLHNRAKLMTTTKVCEENPSQVLEIALLSVVKHITKTRDTAVEPPIFKMVDLMEMYQSQLHGTPQINTTALKEKLIQAVSGLKAYKQGRESILMFEDDVGIVLKKYMDHDGTELTAINKAAHIIRKDIIQNSTKFEFSGRFSGLKQEDAVPNSLLSMINIILTGNPVTEESAAPQVTNTLAQMIKFNTKPGKRVSDVTSYHSKQMETPLPIYISMKIHSTTRKRELVDTMFELGLGIHYDRLLTISTALANQVSRVYETEGIVCPPQLKKEVFIVGAADNIDHNPSSTTAIDSFHGTGISLFQNNHNQDKGSTQMWGRYDETEKKIRPLPELYSNISPIADLNKEIPVPPVPGLSQTDRSPVVEAYTREINWLDSVKRKLEAGDNVEISSLSWSAFHSQQDHIMNYQPATNALLPLFRDAAHTPAMILHAMKVVRQATNSLNPSQLPVIALDQPLFALAKFIQWNWPEDFGEDKYIVMFGGLHIEKAALDVLGDWLEDSGWTEAITQAEITGAGKADSFLNASHITRTRHAHQVTAAALYTLLQKAYECEENDVGLSFKEWCDLKSTKSPQFQYWCITLNLEIKVLILVHSIRKGIFSEYVAAVDALEDWFAALDHYHYFRWLAVHIRDMKSIQHPETKAAFEEGRFVVYKTSRYFSAIAIDHAHEQNNKQVKGQGGAVGLTENPAALLRWTVAGPEISRVIFEFEEVLHKEQTGNQKHHEETIPAQKNFQKEVNKLIAVFENLGNPFLEEGPDLYNLVTKDLAESDVISTVRNIEKIGEEKYKTFVQERLIDRSVPLTDNIKKSNLPLFSRPAKQEKPEKLQVSSLKNSVALFSSLYIGCQGRGGDLDDFFRHENQPCPPSLTKQGQIRSCTKSDLLQCLEEHSGIHNNKVVHCPQVDTVVIDGAAMVHSVKPDKSKTFEGYMKDTVISYLTKQPGTRLDIVWDVYKETSLKQSTREKRGKGVRKKVNPATPLPAKWQQFLCDVRNKTELFKYVAETAISSISCNEKVIVTTIEEDVKSNDEYLQVEGLSPCSQEEADGRLLLHALHQAKSGSNRILIRSPDTDVVVIFVALFSNFDGNEIWISTPSHYVPVHEIYKSLGPAKADGLLFFHALTGCDTVSSFSTIGKTTAWRVWTKFDAITDVFQKLSNIENVQNYDDHLPTIEQYVIFCYDITSEETSVNKERKKLFTKGRQIDNIPPTQDALIQHVKRAIFQAAFVWSQSAEASPVLPSEADWGWKRGPNGAWEPEWTTLPDASKACRELLKCGCRVKCSGRCKCASNDLKCTQLCKCGGSCNNNRS